MNDLDAAAELVRNARSVYILAHIEPDGDAVGSLLGLGWALKALGKETTLACSDPIPSSLHFLPGSSLVTQKKAVNPELVVALDASEPARLGKLFDFTCLGNAPVLVIDHHITNVSFGNVNLVDPTASSAAELVLDLIDRLHVTVNSDIATCLLTGILADTQSFSTSNTTTRSLQAASRLMDAGAPLAEVSRYIFDSKPLAALKVMGRALTDLRIDGRIVWTQVTQAILNECGANAGNSGGIVNVLAKTRDADIAVVFREQPEGRIEVGIRSIPSLDIAGVAVSLGGGGHPQAAGCVLPGPLSEAQARVLTALKRSLEENQQVGESLNGSNS
jgi:bifunctional oligoribonuclease and PAP phosphatase NrnA